MRFLIKTIFFYIILLALSNIGFAAPAKPLVGKEEILLKADSINYEQSGVIIASGNVEIAQENNFLIADQIRYHTQEHRVFAYGNISLLRSNGDVIFSDELELQDDMKKGLVKHFTARMKGDTSLSASNAEIVNQDIYKLSKATYTPCPVCDNKLPQWQITSYSTTVNELEEKVTHKHAFVELYGVPIFYTPYLSHATPHAKPKSGLLTPKFINITDLGSGVKIPYYLRIADNKEAIIAPIVTTKGGTIWTGQYSHLTHLGQYNLSGSYTKAIHNKLPPPTIVDPLNPYITKGAIRYHVFGDGRLEFNDGFSGGFKLARTSDKDYLRKYQFSEETFLTSSLYLDHQNQRNYGNLEYLYFQGLRTSDDPQTTPVIMPLVNYHFESDANSNNSKYFLDSNILSLTRNLGTESNRASFTAGWKLPYITNNGHIFTATTSLRNDFYAVKDVYLAGLNRNFDGNVTRINPELRLDWKYPLFKQLSLYNIIIEPKVDLIISPYHKHNAKIPNEDSQYIELSDANLFAPHHYPGLDLLEYGPRSNYGINTDIKHVNGQAMSIFIGQNYRIKKDPYLDIYSGMSNNSSDYVGRVTYQSGGFFNMFYKFRLAEPDLTLRRNELGTELNWQKISLAAHYITNQRNYLLQNSNIGTRQMNLHANIHLNKNWDIQSGLVKNLSKQNHKLITTTGNLIYYGDCFDITYSLIKDYTKTTNNRANLIASFGVTFKNLTQ